MKYIKNLNFVLTFKCNLKCKHCDIWNNKDNSTIDIITFNKLINEKEIIKSYNYYNNKFELSLSG
jgi:MoaA/NifB/PqqE/SkfB family radical SAM enzyme